MKPLFTLDCEEIFLQEFRLEDVDAIYDITSQPEVYEFLPDWKTTREQRHYYVSEYEIPSNKAFISALPNIEGQGILKLGIIHKETEQFIGFISTGIKEDLPEPNREFAFAISRDFMRRGYATKATKRLIAFLFEETNLEVINAIALPENIGSNTVIEKSGLQYRAEVQIEGQNYLHYLLHKRDWIRNS